MVYRDIRNDSTVADKLFIMIVLLALEGFLFISVYLFSCIAMHVTTWKQLRLLACLESLETDMELFVLFSDITLSSSMSPPSDPAHYR